MLGVRLDARSEARLGALAARSGRSKSDVAREALLRFLDEAEGKDDVHRQLAVVAAFEAANPDTALNAFLDANLAELRDASA